MSLAEQVVIFAWTLAIGMLAGLCYEIYRVTRDVLRLKKAGTIFGDIIFWIFLTFLSFFLLLKANNGQLRLYVFIGLLLGAAVFLRFLGDPAYRLVRWNIYLAGRLLYLMAFIVCHIWRMVILPFRIFIMALVFPLRLLSGLFGGAGGLAGGMAGRRVNAVRLKIAGWSQKILKKFVPPGY